MLALLAAATLQFQCGPAPDLLGALASKYGERPAWTGTAPSGRYVLLESRKGTWTMIFLPSSDVACIIGVGTESKPDFGEPA